jgi:hypothetical protein
MYERLTCSNMGTMLDQPNRDRNYGQVKTLMLRIGDPGPYQYRPSLDTRWRVSYAHIDIKLKKYLERILHVMVRYILNSKSFSKPSHFVGGDVVKGGTRLCRVAQIGQWSTR